VATAKAAADDGAFPAVFGKTNGRGIPVQSLLVHGVLMTAAAFATTSPTIGQQFSKLIDVSVVFSMVCYAYSAIGLFRLQPGSGWVARRYRAMSVIAVVFCAWVVWKSDWNLLMVALLVILTSVPLYPFYKGRLQGHRVEPDMLEAGQGA
jgi:arginine:agmatine antiporter